MDNTGEKSFNVTKWLMLFAGTWRQDLNISKKYRRLYLLYSVVVQAYYQTCFISESIKFFQLWGEDNDGAIECLSMLLIILILVVKLALYQTNQMTSLLSRAIQQVNTYCNIGDQYTQNIFQRHMRYSNILNILITIYSFSLGIHLNVIGFMEYRKFGTGHGNSTETIDKPMVVISWYPFDTNQHYSFVLFHQVSYVLYSDLVNSGFQALINTIIIQLSAQLKTLQYYFRNFTKDIDSGKQLSQEEAHENIKRLIKKHQELISYVEEFNRVLKYPILIEYIVCSGMLAAILVQIIDEKKIIFNLQYFVILAFQFFILSWNANEIRIQSQKVAEAMYESYWYEQNTNTKKLLFIAIARSRKPLSLNIGPFGPLTIEATISRLKLAYSYVSLLTSGKTKAKIIG